MILVFGGTTEGRRVCAALSGTSYPFWYSSKTAIEVSLPANGQYRFGAFTPPALEEFCIKHQIRLIIHASHPFAAILHETIEEVAGRKNIPVIRFERQYPPRIQHSLVQYAGTYEEVLELLNDGAYEPVLSLTGVQTIARMQAYWRKKKMYFRILPRDSSVAIAREANFPESDLLLSFPEKTVADEIKVIQQTGAKAVVTKESGESGFLSVKIDAAIASGIQMFIIRRSDLPKHFISLYEEAALLEQINKIYG